MKSTFLKNSIIYGLGTIIQQIISIVLIPMYTNNLSPDMYGTLSIFMIVINLLVSFFSLGLGTAYLKFKSQKKSDEDQKSLTFTSLVITLSSALIMFLILSILSRILSETLFNTDKYRVLFIFSAMIAGMIMIENLILTIYRSEDRAVTFITVTISGTILKLLLIITFVKYLNLNIFGALLAQVISHSIFSLVLLGTIKKSIKLKFDKVDAQELVKFGTPLVMGNISGIIMLYSDSLLMNHYLGASDVGIYNIASKVSMLFQYVIVNPFKLAWVPYVYKISNKNDGNRIGEMITYFSIISFFSASSLIILSETLIKIFINFQYWHAISVVPLLVWSYVLLGLIYAVSAGVLIGGSSVTYSRIFLIGAISNFIINIFIIPIMGIYGAATSTIISYLLVLALMNYFSNKSYKVSVNLKKIGSSFAISVIMIVVFFMLKDYANEYLLITLIIIFGFILNLKLTDIQIMQLVSKFTKHSFSIKKK